MEEVWKSIVGFEGLYEVSNLGRVRSLNFRNTGSVRIMHPNLARNGYLVARLTKNKRKYHVLVHRAVAMSFIENSSNYPCINHKDENPINNCVDNLEWCTHKYNCNYGSHCKRISDSMSKNGVIQYDMNWNIIATWKGVTDAFRKTGVDKNTISKCCNGIYKQAGGYKWSYIKCNVQR